MKAKALIGQERVRHNRSTRRLVVLPGAGLPEMRPAFAIDTEPQNSSESQTSFDCRCTAAKLNPAVVCLTHSLADLLPASHH